MPEVSIVLPVYNTAPDQFHQCMGSILEQTYTDYEVLLIDDGSDNGTERLCDAYAEKDRRFRVIHQKNKGVSAARNAGTSAASGKWIIYLDPDDWWEKDTLRILCSCMREKDPDLLVFSYFDEFPDRREERRCWKEPHPGYTEADGRLRRNMQIGLLDESLRLLPGYFGAVWGQIQKLDFLRKNRIVFPDGIQKSEDAIFNLQLLNAAEKIGILDISLYHYRHHEDSLCSRYTADLEETFAAVGREVHRFCARKPEEYRKAYQVFQVKNYLAVLRLKYFHPDNPDTEKEKKKQWEGLIRTYGGFAKTGGPI